MVGALDPRGLSQ